jgi:hypothetical protein
MWMMTLLLVHAAATCALAGLAWVVQIVIYPSFLVVGPTPVWSDFHAGHSRRIAMVIGLPWLVQGVSLAALLILRIGPWWLLAPASTCAVVTVVLTVGYAVPLHSRLQTYDVRSVRTLLRVNAWRTVAWSVGAVASLLLVAAV